MALRPKNCMKVQPYSTTRRKHKQPQIGTLSVSEGPRPQGSIPWPFGPKNCMKVQPYSTTHRKRK